MIMNPYVDEPLHYCPDPSTFRALTSQLDLGWFALLYGYITTDMTNAQHNRRKTHGNTWAKQLSLKLWAITYNLWKHRNQILHETDAVHSLSGIVTLLETN